MEAAKNTERVDMSPEAVAARLRDLAALHALGKSLMGARILGPVDDVRREDAAPPGRPAPTPRDR